jgi:tripartite ATP-independent transporter DctM subunit
MAPSGAASAVVPRERPKPWHYVEDACAIAAMAAMAILPIGEIIARRVLGQGVPGAVELVQHLTLWVAFLGAIIAARHRRHLALATTTFLPDSVRPIAGLIASSVACAVTAVLARGGYEAMIVERESAVKLLGIVPIYLAMSVIPLAFAAMALRVWWQAGTYAGGSAEAPVLMRPASARVVWMHRAVVLLVVAATFALGWVPETAVADWRWPLAAVILVATILGAPIYVALGGLALALYYADAGVLSAVPGETYTIVSSPMLPTIPLFTLAGAILAEGGTPNRLVRVFRALAGWLPGGTAVAAILVCAFFTTFTGASGVTILALGGLLLPALLRDVYTERFSLGAITSAGSIGLLFPPSLPVILYAIRAMVPVNELFLAAIVPGLTLVALVSAYSVFEAVRRGGRLRKPDAREMLASLWEAKWELLLPFVVFLGYFQFGSLVRAAALTVLYAFVVKAFIHRDLGLGGQLWRVMRDSVVLVGGVLVILGCAFGLTVYLIDAQVPARMADWVQAGIHSQWAFLLALNGFLLIVGCLMDIFSAIFVVVPLILPVAEVFHVNPVHLGVIFLMNLELGYLTPPVGMNLFLSSYRFNKPMSQVIRAVLPFLLVQAIGVLLVTYVPSLSVGIAAWLLE